MNKTVVSLEEIQTLHQQGHLEQAKQAYLAFIMEHPLDPKPLHYLSLLYAEEGNYSEAEMQLEKALKLSPDDANLSLHLGNIFKAQKKFAKAEDSLLALTQKYPQLPAAFNNLGTVYFAEEKWPEALAAFQRAIEGQANYVDAYYNFGLTLMKLKRFDEAENAYQAVLRLSPSHPGAHFQFARILMQKQNYGAAFKAFSALEKAHPFHFETQTNLASTALKLGLFKEAKSHYQKALTIVPEDTQVLFNLGVISMQEGRIEDALYYYLQAAQKDNQLYDAEHNLGFIYLLKKDKENALLHFKKALSLAPENEALRHTIRILTQDEKISSSPPEYIRSLFDSYADHFDAHLKETLHYQVPNLLYEAIKRFRAVDEPKLTVLDLGCGTGLCGERFKPMARKLIGVDMSSRMLDSARQKNLYDELIEANVLSFLANKKENYDLILAGDVLVYFGELSSLFASVHKALRFDGLFVFDTEISCHEAYQLTEAGRFAHAKSYLDQLALNHQFEVSFYQQATLRTENYHPVLGHIYVLRKKEVK